MFRQKTPVVGLPLNKNLSLVDVRDALMMTCNATVLWIRIRVHAFASCIYAKRCSFKHDYTVGRGGSTAQPEPLAVVLSAILDCHRITWGLFTIQSEHTSIATS